MFIYNGKFDWLKYASNETFTIIFPAGFALNDPVSAYWQWTVDAQGHKKADVSSSGVIQSTTTAVTGDYRRIHFSFGYYSFEATVTTDYKTLTLTMRNPGGSVSKPFALTAMHINPTNIPSTVVYTGRLEWFSYAKEEMTTLVVPYGVAEGLFFGLYHQWTVDAKGVQNANHTVNGVFQDVQYGADGTTTASFQAAYYAYHFTFNGKDSSGSFVLKNPTGGTSEGNKFAMAYSL
uniref:Glucose transporter rco-3 n=1 Tax=Ganoderma boninense TaxID=34458 RepID=A0A5K1K8Y4_9APHY|nr:Glucose transporter rco-3 [Ganoderma boninense]